MDVVIIILGMSFIKSSIKEGRKAIDTLPPETRRYTLAGSELCNNFFAKETLLNHNALDMEENASLCA